MPNEDTTRDEQLNTHLEDTAKRECEDCGETLNEHDEARTPKESPAICAGCTGTGYPCKRCGEEDPDLIYPNEVCGDCIAEEHSDDDGEPEEPRYPLTDPDR